MERKPFPKPPPPRLPFPTAAIRRPLPKPVSTSGPLLPIEEWPDRVYGYHPLMTDTVVVCVRRDFPGYVEVSSEINPIARNRQMGITQDVAEAVIRTAWQPGGHVWHKTVSKE